MLRKLLDEKCNAFPKVALMVCKYVQGGEKRLYHRSILHLRFDENTRKLDARLTLILNFKVKKFLFYVLFEDKTEVKLFKATTNRKLILLPK